MSKDPKSKIVWVAVLLLLGLTLRPSPLLAQEPADTTQAEPRDTIQAVPGPPIGFFEDRAGTAVIDTLPVLYPALDGTALLARRPHSFVYEFAIPGWPDAWSPYGLRPEAVGLTLNAVPYDDLITGRPRFDLLPLEFLEPFRAGETRYGAPVGVFTSVRPFRTAEPLTELRYRSGGDGLQGVTVLHTQTRQVGFFGASGTLNVLGGYGGRASEGPFPGSRLRRERKLVTRVRYERPAWSLEVFNYQVRRRIGAHGGVLDIRAFQPRVINPEARRKTVRNDLSAALRARLLPGLPAPTDVKVFWTAQTSEYRTSTDTLSRSADRYGGRLDQALPLFARPMRLRMAGWLDTFSDTVSTVSRWQWHAALSDTLRLGGAQAVLEGGLHGAGGQVFPTAAVGASFPLGGATAYVKGFRSGRSVPWAEQEGLGIFLQPTTGTGGGAVTQAEAGIRLTGAPFDVEAGVFGNRAAGIVDVAKVDADTARAFTSGEAVQRVGVFADFGWRRDAERGFYATFQPSVIRFLSGSTPSDAVPLASTLPSIHASGRFGARYLLFQGDLDMDLYLQGRFWSEMHSRVLHPPTGLLIVPNAVTEPIGPSGLLSVYLEAGVRTATLFLAYENVLASSAGYGLYESTVFVPGYPLPERRFRFGVYWPITG